MDASFAGQKAGLRQNISEDLATMTDAARDQESRDLEAHLKRFVLGRFTQVLATLPLAGEPDLVPFLTWWLDVGGTVALARTGPGRSMDFRVVRDLAGPWDVKPFGMREPVAVAPSWTPGASALVLVPGLGFAPLGSRAVARLGRGAGYYDRWLAAYGSEVFALGVGFRAQWREALPVEDHDQPLDAWLDSRGFWPAGTG